MSDDELPARYDRIVIGASSQSYPGWLRTQEDDLDLCQRADWNRLFPNGNLKTILMEHVWEHLTPDGARCAAHLCHDFLAPGGRVRCAVPDGLFPDAEYQRTVRVGGLGPNELPAAGHRVVYTATTLTEVFASAGFSVRPLEWWDEQGVFHQQPWNAEDGFIYRSSRFDHRNQHGRLGFTSLILDAIKPSACTATAGTSISSGEMVHGQ